MSVDGSMDCAASSTTTTPKGLVRLMQGIAAEFRVLWARGELDDSQLDNNRVHKKPPRPRSSTRPQSGTRASYQVIVDPVAHRLERKYSELKQLLQGSRPEDSPLPNTDLIHLATKMARK